MTFAIFAALVAAAGAGWWYLGTKTGGAAPSTGNGTKTEGTGPDSGNGTKSE